MMAPSVTVRARNPPIQAAIRWPSGGHGPKGSGGRRVLSLDCPREAVSDPRDRDDEGLGFVAKSLAEQRNIPALPGFLDEAVGPDRLQEIGLRDDMAGPLAEHEERLQDLGRQRDPNAIPQKERSVGRQAEAAEDIAGTPVRAGGPHGVNRTLSLL